MTSLQTVIKQRSVRTYNARVPGDIVVFLQSDFDTWVAANDGKIQQVGNVYSIPGTASGSTFKDVLSGYNGATWLDHSLYIDANLPTLPPDGSEHNFYKSIKNFGKEIHIGDGVESNLLIFRLVQGAGPIADEGVGSVTGYIVVENNASDLTRPRFFVQVLMKTAWLKSQHYMLAMLKWLHGDLFGT